MVAKARDHDRSWQLLADEELRRWLTFYRRRLALADAEIPDPFEREPTRQYLAMLVGDAEAEEARRERAAELGVPRGRECFPPAFVADLKARIRLDELLAYEAGAQLGRPDARGQRRGPCPFCGNGMNSGNRPFGVHLADPADQWYRCFACGAAGDAISAIMQVYGDPFRAAVERLASGAGMPLPSPPPDPASPQVRYVALARNAGLSDG